MDGTSFQKQSCVFGLIFWKWLYCVWYKHAKGVLSLPSKNSVLSGFDFWGLNICLKPKVSMTAKTKFSKLIYGIVFLKTMDFIIMISEEDCFERKKKDFDCSP